jgi:hypothetical protein
MWRVEDVVSVWWWYTEIGPVFKVFWLFCNAFLEINDTFGTSCHLLGFFFRLIALSRANRRIVLVVGFLGVTVAWVMGWLVWCIMTWNFSLVVWFQASNSVIFLSHRVYPGVFYYYDAVDGIQRSLKSELRESINNPDVWSRKTLRHPWKQKTRGGNTTRTVLVVQR